MHKCVNVSLAIWHSDKSIYRGTKLSGFLIFDFSLIKSETLSGPQFPDQLKKLDKIISNIPCCPIIM